MIIINSYMSFHTRPSSFQEAVLGINTKFSCAKFNNEMVPLKLSDVYFLEPEIIYTISRR